MMPNETQRLAHAINDLRPDWPISSLTTFITNRLGKRAYRDVAVALTWVAVDKKPDGQLATETPKRVLEAGPWWQAATVHDGKPRGNFPPKRHEECPKHPGQWPSSCGPCATESVAAYYDPEEPTMTTTPTGPEAARMALRAGGAL